MDLDFKKDDNKFIYKLKGLMDIQNSREVELQILEQIQFNESFCEIELDMSNVEYITSSFIRVCVSIKKHNKVEEFAITNTQDEVFKIFKLLELVKKLDVS
jgi:anti-anti-sigma factor